MNIKFIDDLTFNVYVKKEKLKKINIKNKSELEKYIKEIIEVLKNIYNIKVEGFYDVNVYIDKHYGIILNFNKEKLEYYDYFNGIEINVIIKEVSFL